ncbi:NlpC/P60 family protein [Butyrivibrio sp. AC2005]|uniref:NlpC/P60 family protein n=1 Tax=Butyrivibrio sp. AC2005 TaxID=1280672 RepID=UPI0003FFC254|nr:NlpC/P60 family protein [Butyrivibrio sp. AC2005]
MLKRILAGAMAALMLIGTYPVQAHAARQTDANVIQLKDSVINVVFLLKEVLKDRYSSAEEEIKELIREKGYDYSLSMDSFYDQPNPFKNADYIRFLSVYMSCKKYALDNSINVPQLREIPFLSYEVTESTVKDYVPTKIPHYSQSDRVLDEFILNGDEYITTPTEVDVYEQQQNGHFKTTGEKKLIVPEEKDITYIDVKLSVLKPEDMFEKMGIGRELVDDDYERRTEMIKRVTSNQSISQTVFINLPSVGITSNQGLMEYAPYIEQLDGIRRTIVQTALSLIGKVPYEWGGKATQPGYDTIWWSYNEDNGLQHGLDCSGFVQWTYMTSGFPSEIYGQMGSTKAIKSSSLRPTTLDGLRPGDIGVTNRLGTNHTGIYIGDGLWCHCSSEKKTVTVSKYNSFSIYYSPAEDPVGIDESVIENYMSCEYIKNDNICKNIDTQKSIYYTLKYSYEDEELLAKFISLKARGDGMNCWIAVGEVMKNRVASDMFPGTLSEVIYQNAGGGELSEIEPPEEILNVAHMVLSGQLKVLDNPKAVFFFDTRDLCSEENEGADGNESEWDSYPWFTTINNYVFYSM